MKGSFYTLAYAAILGTVCALLLTGVGWYTRPYRQANAEAEEKRNILVVLEVPFDPDTSSKDLVETFEREVNQEKHGSLTRYVYAENGEVRSIAVPFAGPGLWGPVKGFLSLQPDLRTIRGIAFHEQEETPGLGGEIAAACSCAPGGDWRTCPAKFRHQFKDRKIVDALGAPGIRVLREGGAKGQNEVDGITGATMTGEKVEAMLNAAIEEIVKEK